MKIKTSELTSHALDWAVAKALGKCVDKDFVLAGIFMPGWFVQIESNFWKPLEKFRPSASWAQGGPIIEREIYSLTLWRVSADEVHWDAVAQGDAEVSATGPTPLIAAMRCYVTSTLGDEIDIPEELCQ